MKNINRHAVIVTPKQPMIEWVNFIFPDESVQQFPPFSNDQSTIYLIEEIESPVFFQDWLKQNYRFIFEEELFEWCTDESLWPLQLTFTLFNEWIHASYQSMVVDSIYEEPLLHDGSGDDEDFEG